jgi:hypothetical protein
VVVYSEMDVPITGLLRLDQASGGRGRDPLAKDAGRVNFTFLGGSGLPAARGGSWSATQVMRLLERIGPFDASVAAA